jgi:hypothetical protein
MKITLETIKENLNTLIKLNPNENYRIGRVLTKNEIQKFEEENTIKLPEEYIEFVTQIGSFGFGPNNGLIPLSQYNDLTFRQIKNELSKPFPFTEKKEDEDLYEFEYDSLLNGAILISNCGCGDFDILIVNGNEYGNVWGDYRVSGNGMLPLPCEKKQENERLTFLDWYNNFVLNELERYKNQS